MARLVASVVLLLAVVLGAEKGRNIPYFFGKRYFRIIALLPKIVLVH